MNDTPRFRRSLGAPPPSNRPSMWIIGLVVVLVGLAIGGLAARLFTSGHHPMALPTDAVAVRVTPLPSALPTRKPEKRPSPKPSPSISPKPSPSPTVSSSPSPSPKPSVVSTPTVTPSPAKHPVASSPKPVRATPKARPTASPAPNIATATPMPPAATPVQRAEGTVRSYVAALQRGDLATAESLLGAGVPTERSFITSTTRIRSMSGELQANGRVKIDVVFDSSTGEYSDTFQLDQGTNGWYIADHFATKM